MSVKMMAFPDDGFVALRIPRESVADVLKYPSADCLIRIKSKEGFREFIVAAFEAAEQVWPEITKEMDAIEAANANKTFRDLCMRSIELDDQIQTALDALCAPTTTGYLHREESWTVFWAREGDTAILEVMLEPPEHSYEWGYPGIKKMTKLKEWLGANHVSASPYIDHDGRAKVRYLVSWYKPGEAPDDEDEGETT